MNPFRLKIIYYRLGLSLYLNRGGACDPGSRNLSKVYEILPIAKGDFFMSVSADKSLDCKGLSCPEPILKTKIAINEMQSGQVLEMFATDPGSANDIASWANRTGNELVESTENDGVWQFFIKKS